MKLCLFVVILSLMALCALGTDLDDLAQIVFKPLEYRFGVRDNFGVSMDCLGVFTAPAALNPSSQQFYGVYHSNEPNTNNWTVYLAVSDSGPFGPWQRIQTLVPNIASMPFMYFHQATGQYILAFEHMNSAGNYPTFYFYSTWSDLLNARLAHSFSLEKKVHVAAAPNSYTAEPNSHIHNLGTPSITTAQYLDNFWTLYVRFHFTTDDVPEGDIPGYGVVSYNPSKEDPAVLYFNWQGYFDNDVNNAITIARAGEAGKIGQRGNIQYKSHNFYMYEAQLTGNFDWHNWRLFLYSPQEQRAVQGTMMSVSGVVDFANPSVSLANQQLFNRANYSVVTAFVPSEGISAGAGADALPGCFVYIIPLLPQ
eukprot:gene36837-44686_t